MNPSLSLRDIAFLGASAGGTSLEPDDFPLLHSWWKADHFAVADGTAVGAAGTTWDDYSGNGNHLTQSTASQRPVVKNGILNGRPVVRFTAANSHNLIFTNSFFRDTSQAGFPNGAFTMIVIGNALADSMFFGNDAANYQFRKRRSGANTISKNINNDQSSNVLTSAIGAYGMWVWYREVESGTFHFRENNTSAGMAGVADNFLFTLNRMGRTSFGGYLEGDIAEACLYTGALTPTELDDLYAEYFQPKWGLP